VPQVQHEGGGDYGWLCDLLELWLQQVRMSPPLEGAAFEWMRRIARSRFMT
jgi:hypothetical protein